MLATPTAPLLARIRSATREHHQSLERRLAMLERAWTPEIYRDLLAGFLGFYGPLEERLGAVLPREAVPAHVLGKRALLEADLLESGMARTDLDSLPACDRLPALPSCEAGLGCLYVLEGSTLGGQVLVPHLRTHLDPVRPLGYRFFLPYGGETGRNWRAFCEALETHAARHGREEDTIEAAVETFRTLDAWFQAREA